MPPLPSYIQDGHNRKGEVLNNKRAALQRDWDTETQRPYAQR